MPLKYKRILITGASGFIGGRLTERLIAEEGAHIRAMVRTKPNASPLRAAEIFIGDITDADAAQRAMQGCDAVIHCAALQGARAPLAEFRRVNVGGTLNLLRRPRRQRFSIHTYQYDQCAWLSSAKRRKRRITPQIQRRFLFN
jgi:nucleoside-diphosphate-sugar epimerase